MKAVDLGCGGNKYPGAIGIDRVGRPKTAADRVCLLGFEPIPLADDSIDIAYARHFIEHLPFVVWEKKAKKWHEHHPVIYLFNEVYRILKDGGQFEIIVPLVESRTAGVDRRGFQDPTHVSFWTMETPHYFAGDYYGLHDVYGHTSRFEQIKREIDAHGFMNFTLVARKSVDPETSYLLSYT